jgi:hypothetical protein
MGNSQEEKRKCGDGEYFYQENGGEATGQCRGYAPLASPTPKVTWPEVNVNLWCGEFWQKYQRVAERKPLEAIYKPPN